MFKCVWNKVKEIYYMWLRSTVFNRENLRVGAGTHWAEGCWFNAAGGLIIGNNVLIGPHVFIHTANHNYINSEKLIKEQGNQPEPVIIEDDVWVGANVSVLPGVRLGKGCVVGAGSVVTKDVEPYSVVVGNPAYIIKYRRVVENKGLLQGVINE